MLEARPVRILALAATSGMVALPALAASASSAGEGALSSATFLLLLGLALGAAKAGGELAERVGQPAVLGELLAGVLIGPSVLGRFSTLHLDPHFEPFHLLAEVGVVLLLFEIGLETDLGELLRVGMRSTAVAIIGVAAPFALAFASVEFLVHAGWLAVNPDLHLLLAIFIGATLTATSVGITARVLQDLDRMHTPEARILIGAAVIDDVLGLVILAIVSALGGAAAAGLPIAEAVSPGMVVGKLVVAVGFLALAIVLGRFVAPRLFDFIDALRVRGVLLISAVVFAFTLAWAADAAGSALIIGGFAAGLVLSGTNQFDQIEHRIKPVADVFTPVFFVIVGASVDVSYFNVFDADNHGVLLVAAVLFIVAIIGKLAAGLGAHGSGASKLVIGTGMIPRGEVGLIFAQAGYQLRLPGPEGAIPLLDPGLYSGITLMVIGTTFVAPPALRAIFARQGRPPRAASEASGAAREP